MLLIPAAMIRSLVNERQSRSEAARMEISESWSTAQVLTGPFLSIPTETIKRERREDVVVYSTFNLLPEDLTITGDVTPIEKKRGIFTSVVYDASISVKGSFRLDNEEVSRILEQSIHTGKVFFSLGLSDLRGIGNNTTFRIAGKEMEILPGLHNQDVTHKGVHVPMKIEALKVDEPIPFELVLDLKGSNELSFVPMGKKTMVEVSSPWPDPSFQGTFLPVDKVISQEGFTANWEVNNLNRNFMQQWYGVSYDLPSSAFGVMFLQPADHYQKSERSVKYAFMFIALSFLVFFLSEVILRIRIHPIQYLLVGFALIIFYTLLISLSEQIGFNLAFLVSTVGVLGLIGFYMRSSTGSSRVAMISTILLLALYGFLFTTLQMAELALLMGSIGLFLILTLIMIVSRKVNWYREES